MYLDFSNHFHNFTTLFTKLHGGSTSRRTLPTHTYPSHQKTISTCLFKHTYFIQNHTEDPANYIPIPTEAAYPFNYYIPITTAAPKPRTRNLLRGQRPATYSLLPLQPLIIIIYRMCKKSAL